MKVPAGDRSFRCSASSMDKDWAEGGGPMLLVLPSGLFMGSSLRLCRGQKRLKHTSDLHNVITGCVLFPLLIFLSL